MPEAVRPARQNKKRPVHEMCSLSIWWLWRSAQNPIPFRTRPLNTSAPMVLCLKARESRSPPGLENLLITLLNTNSQKSPANRGAFLRLKHKTPETVRLLAQYRRHGLIDPQFETGVLFLAQTYHSFDPAVGHGLPHDPIKAIIAPRPIGWFSTLDAAGIPNLAPYSFFNLFSSAPPILIFGSEGRKDTISNIAARGEFVFNLATRHQAQAMNQSSGTYPSGVDEFVEAGLATIASDLVAPPRVAGAPAAMECKLLEIKPLVDLDGAKLGTELVIGQVVRVHIDTECLTDGLFDIEKAETLARCGYRGKYIAVNET